MAPTPPVTATPREDSVPLPPREAIPKSWGYAAAFLGALALAPLVISDTFIIHGLLVTCLWAGLALSWNILAGFTGQLSFGHAAFFGVGAYTMGFLSTKFGVSPWIGMMAGGALAALLAAFIGIPAFRLRGPYFALATLALAEVTRIVAIYWEEVTGGAAGLFLPSQTGFVHMSWQGKSPFLWLTLGYLAVVWATAALLKRSRTGYFMAAVREDQDAAGVAGVNATAIKMQAAMISAFFTGVGGAILACYTTFVEPQEFLGVLISIQLLIVTIVGGLGTLSGPVIGAFLATPVAEILRSVIGSRVAGGLHQLIYGLIFLFVMIYLPKGIGPAALRLIRRVIARRSGDNE
jgi:branched-chain amino acid transport system permease protein